MSRVRTLVLILAGGAGGRLELLTHSRAKPAVSFAGTHRLIDFSLSNCHNAAIEDVWVSQQFNPVSLSDHMANGRPWDLDRTNRGLLILHPRQGNDDRGGFPSGTADALWRAAPMIREFAPEALVVLSADAVYALDYGALVDEHMEAGVPVTMVTTEVEPEDAGRYGVVQARDGAVRDYAYKPDEPEGSLICNEVFVFAPDRVLDLLDERGEGNAEEDLGDTLLPALVDAGDVREHRFTGFWRDVGTVDAYWSAHMELLADPPPIDLDDPAWPFLTRAIGRRASSRVLPGAEIVSGLLAPGSTVAGLVERSVIGRGARVEKGATVIDSVILPDAVVGAGARVERAIVDDHVEIGERATVGARDGDVTLLGLATQVEAGAEIPAGARVPDPD